MNPIRLTTFGLITIATITTVHVVRADQYSASGNAAGSQNSIEAAGVQSTNVVQTNQGSLTNDVSAGAQSGGNSGSITTGDASATVDVTNEFNSNQATVGCCPTNTPTPTPKLPSETPSETPVLTPSASIGGPGDGGNGNGGGGGAPSGGGGGGGGQVIGLPAASGENYTQLAITATGTVCLLAGSAIVRKNHLHV